MTPINTTHHRRRRISAGLLAMSASAALVLGACGDDDDDDAADAPATTADAPATTADAPATTAAATETTAAVATTAASDTTAAAETTEGSDGTAAAGDVDAFCQAELAAEAAANSDDPAAAPAAFEALVAAAPDEVRPSVEALIANAQEGPGTPAFDEPYAEMVEYMRGNCGFNEINAVASEYAFDGIPEEVPAGGTILTLENTGAQVHEMAIYRINDDVTETMDELLALPEEEAFSKVTASGFAFAFPGATSTGTADLTAGRYMAVCFLPVGATPEVISQMEGPDSSPPPGVELGPPHFMEGMAHEFSVSA